MKETVQVKDKQGFIYNVVIEYSPRYGFATAYLDDAIIEQVQLGRITEPIGDSDLDWERYEERLEEWKCEIKTNMIPICEKLCPLHNENRR